MLPIFICIIYLLIIEISPVFAFEMKSKNYRIQLDPSDVDALPRASSMDDLKKDIDTDALTAGLSSNTNNKLLKFALIGLFLIPLIIWSFKRTRTKFEIRRKA